MVIYYDKYYLGIYKVITNILRYSVVIMLKINNISRQVEHENPRTQHGTDHQSDFLLSRLVVTETVVDSQEPGWK